MRIGIIGHSGQLFDEFELEKLIKAGIALAKGNRSWDDITIVSKRISQEIPLLVYKIAKAKQIKTMGVASPLSISDDWALCDRLLITHDESSAFLFAIDALICIGGGPICREEVRLAKADFIPVFEVDLPQL
jgi:hypothetical protein